MLLSAQDIETKARCLGSLLLFTKTFYRLRTGREFEISHPVGRESHFITICRELTDVLYLNTNRLLINVPPGHGKSELMIHFVCWAMAHYPDSKFLYISYGLELAAGHTYTIKQIMQSAFYRHLFDIEIKRDSSAKDNFQTLQGGAVRAFGSEGPITGTDAGLPNLDRFSGALIMDDMHKPKEVESETTRESVKSNYATTIEPRPRGPNVPLVFIGQRLHEDDLPSTFIRGEDGYEWRKVILKGLDEAGNALHPKVMPRAKLLITQAKRPYVFASQQQQDPLPAGGALFKPDDFIELGVEPNLLATFVTADTAETSNTYNDPTVFSFWGIYRIEDFGADTGIYALHWLDCDEFWCEPRDLESHFNDFYMRCMRHPMKPSAIAIEKKSTGVTLLSVLKGRPGLRIIDIERTAKDGSKGARFIELQPYIAQHCVTLPEGGRHNQKVIDHCKKITPNNTHAHDDIADTLYDAVKLGLIDKSIITLPDNAISQTDKAALIMATFKRTQRAKRDNYGTFR